MVLPLSSFRKLVSLLLSVVFLHLLEQVALPACSVSTAIIKSSFVASLFGDSFARDVDVHSVGSLRRQSWRPDMFSITPPLLAKTFCPM